MLLGSTILSCSPMFDREGAGRQDSRGPLSKSNVANLIVQLARWIQKHRRHPQLDSPLASLYDETLGQGNEPDLSSPVMIAHMGVHR